MASIEYRVRSTRVVAYVNKEKVSFPLGKVTKKNAEQFRNNIDTLLHEHRCNLPTSREVSRWLAELDDSLFELLANADLVDPRVKAGRLSSFIDDYIRGKTDVSEKRRGKFRNAKKRLIEHFGDEKLCAIKPGDADEYARSLLKTLAPATAHKECQMVGQFFRHACRKDFIEKNPFDGVTVGTATCDDRREFISQDRIEQVLNSPEICIDWQWRTIVALARFGGLRCSSEVSLLKWSDIDWKAGRFTVTSPKTQRYNKKSRVTPIFPELRPHLEEAFARTNANEKWVVPMLGGNPDKNLGTTFKRRIARHGLQEWAKPFQNLRSSRQTELEQHFPTYVVCSWLGNTPKVALKHYLTVTDEHFASASKTGDVLGMQTPVLSRTEAQKKTHTFQHVRENASFSEVVGMLDDARVAAEGLEPPTRGL